MKETYNLAVVGCGDIARRGHFPSFEANHRVEVVAVSDVNADRAHAMAEQYKVSIWNVDYQEMITLPQVDAVFVLTPPQVTTEVTISALQAGKDVFCEKPMGISLDDAHRIREAERASGRIVQVGFKNTHSPLMLKLKERVEQGWFGTPLVYNIASFDEAFHPANMEHYERIVNVLKSGSPMFHEGSHVIDFLRWFSNSTKINRVMATGLKSQQHFARPNYVGALIELSNGDMARLESAWLYPHFFPGDLDILGPNGVARMSRSSRKLVFHDGKREEVIHMTEDWNQICFERQLDYFISCLDHRRTPVPGSLEGFNGMRYIAAIEQSLLERRPIFLDE